MDLISVIVPVYNVEQYLPACAASILGQTWPCLEVILVDDGSTDGSGAICDALAESDPRVRVIHKENGGAASARNCGIGVAAGQYLSFVDADDLLLPGMLQRLHELLEPEKTGIAVCDYLPFSDDNGEFSCCAGDTPVTCETVALEKEYVLSLLNKGGTQAAVPFIAPWGKLYSREIFQNLRYPENVRYEDEHIVHRAFDRAEQIFMINQPLYRYRQRLGSYMYENTRDAQKKLQLLDALEDRIAFYAEAYPQLLSGAVRHLRCECQWLYEQFGRENRAEQKQLRKRCLLACLRHWRKLSLKEIAACVLFSFSMKWYMKLIRST